jgi:RimJ/RimL family protein N-acetyltransferase
MPGARVASGERVTLRTVEREDVEFLQRGAANPELRYPLGARLLNREQVEEVVIDDSEDQFLDCVDSEARSASNDASGRGPRADDDEDAGPGHPEEGDTRPIGFVGVEDADWRRPEIVYWLVPDVHGEGYGREAVSLVVDFVFRTYDHPAVGAGAYAFNDASRGLLESLGFEEEGRVRRDRFVDGEYVDSVKYGLLREDWRE